MAKCPVCGVESKHIYIVDGSCSHWNRMMTDKELKKLKKGLSYELETKDNGN